MTEALDRIAKAAGQFRVRARRQYFANQSDRGMGRPTPSVLDGVDDLHGDLDASPAEIALYFASQSEERGRHSAAMTSAAVSGMAGLIVSHEANSHLSNASWALKGALEAIAADRDPKPAVERARHAITKVNEKFEILYKQRPNSGRSYRSTSEMISDLEDEFWWLREARYGTGRTLEFTDEFRACTQPFPSQLSGTVLPNIVQNAYFNGGKDARVVIGIEQVIVSSGDPDAEDEWDRKPKIENIVTVEDSGPGIELAYREKIFEPFQSGRGSSGVGLYLSRRIMRHDGYDIVVGESASLGGAKFSVGRASVVKPTLAPEPSIRLDLAACAYSLARSAEEGRMDDLLRHSDVYADIKREHIRIAAEGPLDDADLEIVEAVTKIEEVLRLELAQTLEADRARRSDDLDEPAFPTTRPGL